MLMHRCYCIDSICWCICHDSPRLIYLWSYYCICCCICWCICRAALCWCIIIAITANATAFARQLFLVYSCSMPLFNHKDISGFYQEARTTHKRRTITKENINSSKHCLSQAIHRIISFGDSSFVLSIQWTVIPSETFSHLSADYSSPIISRQIHPKLISPQGSIIHHPWNIYF